MTLARHQRGFAGISPRAVMDPACPVEWGHPLNRGLVAWYLTPPNSGWRGGTLLRDLVRGGKVPHDATLTAGPTWQGPKGRPGGFGCLTYASASSQYAEYAAALVAARPLTLVCWARAATIQSSCMVSLGLTAAAIPRVELQLTGTGGIRLVEVDTGSSSGIATAAATVTVGAWHHVVGVCNATNSRTCYLDGVGAANSTSLTTITGLTRTTIGRVTTNAPTRFYDGHIDDVRVYSRALSAAEVASLFDQSKRGHPDTLRWISPGKAWFSPAAVVAGFVPPQPYRVLQSVSNSVSF